LRSVVRAHLCGIRLKVLAYWLGFIRWLAAGATGIAFTAALAVALVSNRLDTLRAKEATDREVEIEAAL
jgi:hypothetical protein